MFQETILCYFAAFGIILLGWLAFGVFLFPLRRQCVSVFYLYGTEQGIEQQIRCWLWLRSLHLCAADLILLDAGASDEAGSIARRFAAQYPCIFYFSLSEME